MGSQFSQRLSRRRLSSGLGSFAHLSPVLPTNHWDMTRCSCLSRSLARKWAKKDSDTKSREHVYGRFVDPDFKPESIVPKRIRYYVVANSSTGAWSICD